MAGYSAVISKQWTPRLESFFDDWRALRDKEFFRPNGTQVYVGAQGQGKTISGVRHLLALKERYPKAILVTNLQLFDFHALPFSSKSDLLAKQSHHLFDPAKHYFQFSSMEELEIVLVNLNNDKYGVIYFVDEIHTYFNSLESKNIPMFVFTEISQQRKQRKLIIGTSQLFTRMAKPFREQCDNIIVCSTTGGILTSQRAYDGMSLVQEFDGTMSGKVRRSGWFWHDRALRSAFDTYQKVVSGAEQYESLSNPKDREMTFRQKGKLKIK